MIENWQLQRLLEKVRDLPSIRFEYLKELHGKFYHVSLRGKVSYHMTPGEIDNFVRSTQLKANVGFVSVDGYIVIIYSDSIPQRELQPVITRIINQEPNFNVEELWTL